MSQLGASDMLVEVQPNAQAPLLRNERGRREWLEKELDLCNMVRNSLGSPQEGGARFSLGRCSNVAGTDSFIYTATAADHSVA